MARVRVVGRRPQAGRCVYCHDMVGTPAGDTACGGCGALLHSECRTQLSRCPTIGCERPLPAATPMPARSPVAVAPRLATWEPRITTREGAPPGSWARFGPYSRLVVSALFNLVLLTCLVLAASFVLLRQPWKGAEGYDLLWGFVFGVCGVLLAFVSGDWLKRLPRVWGEVGRLLDRTRPVAMTMRVLADGEGDNTKWTAELSDPGGAVPPLFLRLSGFLAPGWLRRHAAGRRVWVYGHPGPGPYLLEMPDGWLALLVP